MKINQEQVREALKQVIYFPKKDNIIALNMLTNLKTDNNTISFEIIFSDPADPGIKNLLNACEAVLKESFGEEIQVAANPVIAVPETANSLSMVKNIIVVASGKGGVGKSTVATNLAISLSKKGNKVALLDADIYGPSIPIMLGLQNQRPEAKEVNGKLQILPIEKYGLKILSIGFFVESNQALIWRGPMAAGALGQLFNDTIWGEVDYMIVDLPPGTGDVHLTLAQSYPVNGAIIVTTPQQVALADVKKAACMFMEEKIKIPIIGLIENMSYFIPDELPDHKYYIFGKGHARDYAETLKVPYLGEIPMQAGIAESGDQGTPITLRKDGPVEQAFADLAEKVMKNTLPMAKN